MLETKKFIDNFLEELCRKYFEANSPEFQKYVGWATSDDYPNCIGLQYDYFDWEGNYECDTEWISMEKLVEFNKEHNE